MPAFPTAGWAEDQPEAFSVEQEGGAIGAQEADAAPMEAGEEEEPVKARRGRQQAGGGWRAGAADT